MTEIEDETVNESGDQELIRALEGWRQHIKRREAEMVRNIYAYCRVNVFDSGVFLVGAAHKSAIAKRIEKYAGAEADLIDWKFFL